ncbi:hypothetical protein [Vibrio harveyi]|uniref:hypothetical protein n=1 Tax=Vibrio harveyi TaxID=669 RepID=UPI0004759C52|nr:hypothetical protein [Vibrio harveyi]GEA22290.1 hypothetical protein VH1807_contig00024-0008 [Vibrio harveyi]
MNEISMQEWAEQVLERRKAAENSLVTISLAGCMEGRDYNVDKQDFSEPDLGLKALEEFKLITFSGYDGMISVWIDDEEHYHGEFVAYGVILDQVSKVSFPELKIWLKEWLPKINKPSE